MRNWCLLLLFTFAGVVSAQDTGTRQIWDSGFRQHRPPAPKHAGASQGSNAKRDLKYEGDKANSYGSGRDAIVGVTIWTARLPGQGEQSAPRLLVQDQQTTPTEYVFDRLEPGEPLRADDRVRLAIEAPRSGYLYVIDRERFNDGSAGPPYLIFPASRLNRGDNHVVPGQLIEIPAQSDPVPLLRLQRRSSSHIGEDLLVILSPAALPDLVPGEREVRLDPSLVARWEREWAVDAQRLDLAAGQQAIWTAAEKDAGNKQRLLTQDDPMPQTIYFGPVQKNRAVLIRVPIEIR
jgi:hypothetical protein